MNEAPLFREPLLRTPFHERARALSQLDSFIPWNGYTTVDVFSTVEHEYFAIRNACTLYDLSPMAKYRITGPDALRFMNRLVTRDLAKLKPNRVAYAVWCDDEGHLIDDGTVFRLGESEYRLCAQERQLDWLLDSAIGYEVEIADVTEAIAGLALQGPTSCAVLKKLGLAGVERLKPFDIGTFALEGTELTLSRTGFTGDLGYEVWMDPRDAEGVWDRLMAAGHSRGIRPLGSRALNILFERRKQLGECFAAAREKRMRMTRLGRTPARLGFLGQDITIDNRHVLRIIGKRLRGARGSAAGSTRNPGPAHPRSWCP